MTVRHLLAMAAVFAVTALAHAEVPTRLTVFAVTALARAESPTPLTVFAAVSLTETMQQLGGEFTKQTGVPVRLSFASSSVLARQIEAGSGADVFVSADQQWMDYLEQRGLVDTATRRDLLSNRLVLIAPADRDIKVKIAPGFALGAALGGGRLVTGDPDNVPVGRYAKQALTRLGVWDSVSSQLVRAEDVRHALQFVARGECPLGIVYATDAKVERRVRVVDTFPVDSHAPIAYPVARLTHGSADAVRFLEFLGSDAGRKTFERAGFIFHGGRSGRRPVAAPASPRRGKLCARGFL
jgi:molybdate transport system substrate-binding protein